MKVDRGKFWDVQKQNTCRKLINSVVCKILASLIALRIFVCELYNMTKKVKVAEGIKDAGGIILGGFLHLI